MKNKNIKAKVKTFALMAIIAMAMMAMSISAFAGPSGRG